MSNLEIYPHQVDEAILVMREVAAWGRNRGFRVWPDEWLTDVATPDDLTDIQRARAEYAGGQTFPMKQLVGLNRGAGELSPASFSTPYLTLLFTL